jgi:hypothetical protein
MAATREPVMREIVTGGSGPVTLARWWAALIAANTKLFLSEKSRSV